jgi:hypothetical protein
VRGRLRVEPKSVAWNTRMDTYLQELHDTLARIASSIYREYNQVPTSQPYREVRLKLLAVHEQLTAAQAKIGEVITEYHLLPDSAKAWRRRV